MTSEYTLSEQQRFFVDQQVASGHYATAEDVVADALRLLEARQDRLATLDKLLDDGLADLGQAPARNAEDVFDELERAYRPLGMPHRQR